MKSTINTKKDSLQTLSSNVLWSSPIPHFQSPRSKPITDIKVATIVSDRLYHGLKYECDLLLLTPENWKNVIDYAGVEFFLLESFWDTATGHWHLCQAHDGKEHKLLLDIIAYCDKNEIPTVYWNTQDTLYHEHFVNIMKLFKYVFCADINEVEKLKKESIVATVLLPAIQPVLHNPFKNYEHANSFNIEILYDGWADILRMGSKLNFLKEFKARGLSIIESQYRLFKSKLADSEDYKDNILGAVNMQDRLMALKYSNICISSENTISTPMRQQWLAFEVVACRLLIIHKGNLDKTDCRHGIVESIADEKGFVNRINKLLDDDFLKEKNAHYAWRKVYSEHTFSHRLRTICKTIDIKYEIEEYPLVSVIIATFRLNLLSSCIERFEKQYYPNKELVLVINSNEFTQDEALNFIGDKKNIRIYIVPLERVEGGCLNFAISAAKGKYCIKMDDDDFYSVNFISDMILHNKSIDADVFGKGNSFIHFEDDDTTYRRKERPQLTIIPKEKILNAHISGNSLSGKKSFFMKHPYSDTNMASTDTCFHGNVENGEGVFALLDELGLIMARSSDVRNHSWRLDSGHLKKQMSFLTKGISDNILI